MQALQSKLTTLNLINKLHCVTMQMKYNKVNYLVSFNHGKVEIQVEIQFVMCTT